VVDYSIEHFHYSIGLGLDLGSSVLQLVSSHGCAPFTAEVLYFYSAGLLNAANVLTLRPYGALQICLLLLLYYYSSVVHRSWR